MKVLEKRVIYLRTDIADNTPRLTASLQNFWLPEHSFQPPYSSDLNTCPQKTLFRDFRRLENSQRCYPKCEQRLRWCVAAEKGPILKGITLMFGKNKTSLLLFFCQTSFSYFFPLFKCLACSTSTYTIFLNFYCFFLLRCQPLRSTLHCLGFKNCIRNNRSLKLDFSLNVMSVLSAYCTRVPVYIWYSVFTAINTTSF